MDIPNEYRKNLYLAVLALLVVLSLFFAVKFLSELRSYGLRGASETSTITVSGHGEIMATPDIATVSFTISKDAKTVKEAQDSVAKIEKDALDFIFANGVAEKDVKTQDASFYPKYEYRKAMVCNEFGCNSNSVIVGYTASETVTVKVRNTDNAAKIIEGLGSVGVTQLNGPSFEVDDADALKVQARKQAIEDARIKAESLAKDLGVKLVRISSFNESGNYYPMYATKAVDGAAPQMAMDERMASLPTGENTISSDVTISYEIR